MIKKFSLTIPPLSGNEERAGYIYLPPTYEENTNSRYPVLYMFDGQNIFFDEDATYKTSWGLSNYLEHNPVDMIILGAEPYDNVESINLKEIILKGKHPWTNKHINELDISKNTIIVLIKRKNKALIPNGNMILKNGDRLFLYTKLVLEDMNNIEI